MTVTSARQSRATDAASRHQDAAFRHQMERDAVWSRMISPGARIPDLPLIEADLGPIFLHRLLDTGPLVLMFFAHAGAAGAEAALRTYEKGLAGVDAHLVAVSPQRPERLAELKHRARLTMLVAADPRHALIDAFNIGYSSPAESGALGTGRSTLPYPAVVVADRSGVVRFVEVSPDPANHTRPAAIIDALRC
ncbi:redoxin domain-containing protein [Actinoplanes sp. N902-109]|uniref:redoxin domain-containing protein n=1 Tax=Actinoplanes sp. (strain N902-109) TaxID=649831 RepID=UPI00032941AF|nr:redoxin domain-containing protein [Actinoplanes sp. N902-109]AGL17981.1 alkyl hydroperoxide reductase/ Thiol specific antioxidant/ Mal allergen [Actinoplanes sp. N902-109]